ncbi:hypothetical protein ACH42_14060 [Endozoicomonas sp. (ex Bugula neritina AB1)]|nr:hypothetical protein ACH42_14060 [Endozoicomonas sp. (ex Bugula neritina AB1)]
MNALLWLAPIILYFVYWFDTAAAKELAVTYGHRACKDVNVQFLDESVVRYHTQVKRGYSGNLCFARDFKFEFTVDGSVRHYGYIRLLGKKLQMLDMDIPNIEEQSNGNHLILTASYSEDSDTNALCQRTQERPDC